MSDPQIGHDNNQASGAARAEAFHRDGFIYLRSVLCEKDLALLEEAHAARMSDVAIRSSLFLGDDRITSSMSNSINHPSISRLIRDSVIADLAQSLFGGEDVWYWTEQAWLKESPEGTPRTPWHQDMSYVPFAGDNFVVLWIPLENLPAENVLEIVRGSHRGTLYNGTKFDPSDVTAPLYEDCAMPRLPDIDGEPGKWDIVAEPMNRGDILAFHPACLHGGAPTAPGQRRRAVSFRFFSGDVVYRPLPQVMKDDYANDQLQRKERLVPGFEKLTPGDPIHRSGSFRKIRPWGA